MSTQDRGGSELVPASSIETEYQARMNALDGSERVARAFGMLQWTREMLARRVVEELGPLSEERLK